MSRARLYAKATERIWLMPSDNEKLREALAAIVQLRAALEKGDDVGNLAFAAGVPVEYATEIKWECHQLGFNKLLGMECYLRSMLKFNETKFK